MKIGIMSMQRVKNYGSFLQAYALKSTLEKMGNSVEFVDYTVEAPIIYSNTRNLKTVLKKYIRKGRSLAKNSREKFILSVLFGVKNQASNFQKSKYFSEIYNQKFLPELGICADKRNIRPDVDTLIIGSDEVFNCLQGTGVGYSKELFGYKANSVRKISYAASFGFTTYEKLVDFGIYEEIKAMLKEFNALSARDDNTVNILTKMGFDCEENIDPVLIYDFSDEIIEKKCDKYMLIYSYTAALSTNQKIKILEFAKKHNLKTICMGCYQNFCDEFIVASPFEVLGYFKNADYVVTSTFHGTVLSIKYNVPFVTIVKQYNEQKLESLLQKFLLSDRVIRNNREIEIKLKKNIEYDSVNWIIKEEKLKALKYLEQNI